MQGSEERELAHYRVLDFGIQTPVEWRRLASSDPLEPLTLVTPHGGLFRATSIPARPNALAIDTLLANVDGAVLAKRTLRHPSGAGSAEAITREGELLRKTVLVSGPGAEAILSLLAPPPRLAALGPQLDAVVASVFFGARLDPGFPERARRAFERRWPRLRFRLKGACVIEAIDGDGRAWHFGLAGIARKIVADPAREAELIDELARGLGSDVRRVARNSSSERLAVTS